MQTAIFTRMAQGRQDAKAVDDTPDETYAAEDDVQPSDEPDTVEDEATAPDDTDGPGLSDPDLDIFAAAAALDDERKKLPEGLVEIDAHSLLDECNGLAQRLAGARVGE